MAKRTFQALAIVLAVSLVALVSFTAGATSGTSGADAGESGESLWQRLHSVGHQLHHGGGGHGHGGGGFGHQMGELVEQLNLSEEQKARFEAIHRTFESWGGRAHGSMAELHDELVEQFEQGFVEADVVRQRIEEQLADLRTVAYSVTDDLLALVNSLDAEQREIVLAHIEGAHGGHGP